MLMELYRRDPDPNDPWGDNSFFQWLENVKLKEKIVGQPIVLFSKFEQDVQYWETSTIYYYAPENAWRGGRTVTSVNRTISEIISRKFSKNSIPLIQYMLVESPTTIRKEYFLLDMDPESIMELVLRLS